MQWQKLFLIILILYSHRLINPIYCALLFIYRKYFQLGLITKNGKNFNLLGKLLPAKFMDMHLKKNKLIKVNFGIVFD
jgi:hypothetical protein